MRKLLFVIILLAINSTLFAQRGKDPSAFVDSVVSSFRGNSNCAVIVGVVKMVPGQTPEMWKFPYGHMTTDTNSSPLVNDSTLFQIGSITKTFNATLLSMLVNNGTINLYDTVKKYVPDSVHVPVWVEGNDTTVIRFIDLATHYSGLDDEPPIGSGGMTTYQEMFNYLDTCHLFKKPGECYVYSDLGFALLGVAIQTILQDSIELLIPNMVCDTLGMYDSRIIDFTPSQLSRLAQGYKPNLQPAPALMPNWPAYYSAGGITSTLNDMMTYLQFAMQIDNHGLQGLLDTLMLERRLTNDSCLHPESIDSVGLAWQFGKLFPNNPSNQIRSTFKDGSTAGFCSYMIFATHPTTNVKTGVVMISNWKNSGPLQNTATEILKFMNGLGSIGIQNNSEIAGYKLGQNYPNPFNPKTVINYSIPRQENVTIKVYDVLGNEIATLINKKQEAGNYSIEWDGEKYSSGVYYYKITAGDFVETKKMTLVK